MNRGARGGPRGGRGGVRGRGGRGAGARGGAARGRGAGRRALPTPAPAAAGAAGAAATADPASPKPQRQRALPTPTTATTSNDPVADELPDVPPTSSDNQTTEEQQSSTPISPRRALPNPARNATAGRSAQRRGLPQPGRRGVGRNVSRSGGGRGAGRGAPSNNTAIPKRELPPRAQTPPSDDENNDSASEEIETTIIESKPAQPIQKIPSRGAGGGAARRLPIASRSRQLPVARGPMRSARGGAAGRGRGRGGLKQPDAGPAKALPKPNQSDESSNSHLNYAKLPRESSIKPKESKETEEEQEENNENNDDFEEDPFANEDDVFNAPPMHSPEPANDDIFDEMPDMAPPDIDEEFNLADLGDVEDIDAELARVEAELAKVQADNDLDDLDDNMFDDMDQINKEEEEEKKRLQQEQDELQKQEEAKRKRAEMQRKAAEEQRRAEIERKRQEQQRIAEEKRKAEEARRAAEAEAARIEEQRRLEEQRKLAAIPDTIEVEIEEEIETFEMREKKVPHPDMIDYDPSDTRKRSRAVAKYIGQEEGELNFEKGDLVIIEQQEDDGWWLGVNKNGDNGWFEFHYVELIEWPLPPVIKKERVKVMKTVKKTVSRPNPEKERLRRQLASAANKKLPATPAALRPAAPLPSTASRGRGVGRAPGRNRPPRAAPAFEEPAVDNISAIDEAIAEKASTSRLKTIRKPGARTGRRPPTRRKKVAIETKTQTEAPVVIEATKEDEAPLHHTGPQFGMGMMGSTRRGGSGVRAPRGSGIRAPRGRGRGAGRAARPPAPTPADPGPPPFGGAGIGFDDDPFTASTGPKRPQPTPQPAARRGRGGGPGRAPSRRGGRGVVQTPSGRKMPVGAVNIFGGAGGFDPFAGKASADTSAAPVADNEFDQYDNNNAVSTPASQPSSVTSSRRLSWDAKQSAGTQQREDQFNAPVSTTNMGDASTACLCPICGKAYLTPNDVVIHTQKRHADAGYKDINQESVTDEKPTAPSQSRSKAQRAKNMFAGVTQTLGRRNRSAW